MPKRIILSLGVGGRFAQGVKRMEAGARANGYAGVIRAYDAYPEGCPRHEDVPYGFKAWLMMKAADEGFEQILWLDAACVPVRPLARLWHEIERDGCAFPLSHLSIGEWCSDAALETMAVTREAVIAMKPSIWACVMGLDVRNPTARQFLCEWYDKSRDGRSFHGPWTNEVAQASKDKRVKGHRHDQTIATILAYRLGLPFSQNIVEYDVPAVMPLEQYESRLRIPWWRVPILSNHNVK